MVPTPTTMFAISMISTAAARTVVAKTAATSPSRQGSGRSGTQNAVKQAGAVVGYTIGALVADGEIVTAAWTGTLPGGAEIGKGLSLYRTSGGLLRSTRHALIGTTPS